jgi:hypothetical protein
VPTAPPARRRGRAAERRLKFDQRLVLLQWMLGLFEVGSFDALAELLKDPRLEGFDEDNVSRFARELTQRLFDREELPAAVLLGYDENIVRHWNTVAERRSQTGQALYPKYFQYLALLFTEIYLDRYFHDEEALLASLNAHVERFNEAAPRADQVSPFEPKDLRKIAFWMATGSGKTLLMHVNILQYRHYLKNAGRERELNRVILLTPNEGLSKQHLGEFQKSGMSAELFNKEGAGAFAGQMVEIIDIHKLKEDMGDKTVAVDAFESNNLVLVDEGHRGAGGVEWMDKRNRLSERGFSFEYSATFGQAMKAANKATLTEEYAKSILFDYSYKYFYRDGYGKDYHILNLETDDQEEERRLYLTACLLAFYQQLRVFHDEKAELHPFLLERPLWVFVGGSVNAVRTQGGRSVSDVVDILLFLADFVRNQAESTRRLELLLQGKAGLHDSRGHELFRNTFAYLQRRGGGAAEVFSGILGAVFNAASPGKLHVELLKGSDGEIALKLGENDPFGVINVGDAPKLVKLCEEFDELVVTEREFSGSLFHRIDKPDSTVNVLIGSKKFSEGWNSWRVSTMGLMNIGRSEGSEIIQLFGRGVRLKGYGFSLKRSQHISGIKRPEYIRVLETLHIFGVRADYMRQFKEYLEDEGLPANEDIQEFVLPVVSSLGGAKLRTVRLQAGLNFKADGEKPTLDTIPESLLRHPVGLDWYPKIQSERSKGLQGAGDAAVKQEGKLTRKHIAFLDMDALFFELERFKAEHAWHNLNLPRDAARTMLEDPRWYRLFIPSHMLDFTGFHRVRVWQEIAATLLKKYCERYYTYRKQEWEAPFMEYRELDLTDPNLIEEYRFMVDRSQQSILATLEQLKNAIEAGTMKDVELGTHFRAIFFDRHLYQPLVHLKNEFVEVRPVPLNEGERDFVLDLRKFHQSNAGFFAGKELYLLRNQSRGRGIGFFEAGNFHPDFILWLLDGSKQYVTFVDPKGLRNLEGPDDPKIRFYHTIKELEKRLGDPAVVLNSFIISQTPHQQVGWWDGGMSETDFEQKHVLFRSAEGELDLRPLFRRITAPVLAPAP